MSTQGSLIPTSDAGLLDFAVNFDTVATPIATALGLTAAMMTSYHNLVLDYQTRRATAAEPSTRTRVTVQEKNTSKAALLASSRQLVKIVDAFPGTTNAQRASLNIRIPDTTPTPIPAPTTQPVVNIGGTGGGLALLRLRDQTTPDKKAKPDGVFGALVSTAITDNPDTPPAFVPNTFNALVTRTNYTISLPTGSAGKTLWVQAQWINQRGEPGPLSTIASGLIAA